MSGVNPVSVDSASGGIDDPTTGTGGFDAEQIDNAQNLMKVAATARPPGAPRPANAPALSPIPGLATGFTFPPAKS
mgnify:CR=1 FL=1